MRPFCRERVILSPRHEGRPVRLAVIFHATPVTRAAPRVCQNQ